MSRKFIYFFKKIAQLHVCQNLKLIFLIFIFRLKDPPTHPKDTTQPQTCQLLCTGARGAKGRILVVSFRTSLAARKVLQLFCDVSTFGNTLLVYFFFIFWHEYMNK